MIAAITMVRDEADIIRRTIGHLLTQGIDRIYVLENLSTDNTPQILDQLATMYPRRVHVIEDHDPAYYQARKMNGLAHLAGAHDATWILPFDADEFWYAPHGTVADWIAASDADVIHARTWALYGDYREPEPKPLPKVCYRYHPSAVLAQGAHSVDWPGSPRIASGLEIREYQYRSLEQMIRKLRTGKAAYDATNLPESEGAHWRQLGALTDDEIAVEFAKYVDAATIYDPPPWA